MSKISVPFIQPHWCLFFWIVCKIWFFLNCRLCRLAEVSLSLWFEIVIGSICWWTTIVAGMILWLITWLFAEAFCLLRPAGDGWQGRSAWGTLDINAMLTGEHLWLRQDGDLSSSPVCGLDLYLWGPDSRSSTTKSAVVSLSRVWSSNYRDR